MFICHTKKALTNCVKCFFFRLKIVGKNRLITSRNSLHELPTDELNLKFTSLELTNLRIQKPLSIKVSKMDWRSIYKQIKFLKIFGNLSLTSASLLVFHNNVFAGQSFCINNSSSLFITILIIYNLNILIIYNLTFLTTVSGLILDAYWMSYKHAMHF